LDAGAAVGDDPRVDQAGGDERLAVTDRTRVKRESQRQVTDRQALYDLLDAGLVAHVAACVDGLPAVLPVGYARAADTLLLHGSTGGGLLRQAAAGAPLAVAVTLLDGLVFARSLFDSSMDYRSAVVFGVATPVPDERKEKALRLLGERLMPGRWVEVRPPTRRELAATLVLELPLAEASVKIRSGPPEDSDDPPPDPAVWAGVLPLRSAAGEPVPGPDVPPGVPVPPSVRAAVTRLAGIGG
jgi:nitroimidazol reductase NimA-like FMN-containing flavoprotein (pyridoxamine 5'-phosphate oxidase superfamily)